MSNDICCIITIRRRDYDFITSRLASFQLLFSENKQVEVCLLVNSPENIKKTSQYNKKMPHKCENTMIRVTDRNYSNYLIGSNSSSYDDKFIYDASCLRVDNNFKNMAKGWSVFSETKELYTKKIEIETYIWKKAFQLEFIHNEKEEVLMIMKDCTSCNMVDKNTNADREYWKLKLSNHFKDLYHLFCNNYCDAVVSENQSVGLYQANNRPKASEFDQRCKIFLEKIEKFSQKNHQKTLQFWLIRIACIAEFVLKHRPSKNNHS